MKGVDMHTLPKCRHMALGPAKSEIYCVLRPKGLLLGQGSQTYSHHPGLSSFETGSGS